MRLTDLLHPHLDDVTSVVDATSGGLRLGPYLHLPPGVEPTRHEQPVGEGELMLLCYGPDLALHGDEADCLAALERMRPGGRGLIVFGHPGTDLPYHRLLDALVAHRCQVLHAASLGYTHLHAGAVFACTEELLPPHDWFGRPLPADGFATALRIADEYVLADFVSRSQRARLIDLERAAEESARALETAREDGLAERLAAALRDKDQLSSALRRAQARTGVLESRVAMLEGSTSLRVGKALVSAARSPKRRAVRLPGELYGLWRQRKVRGGGPSGALSVAPASAPEPQTDDRFHLSHRALSVAPRDRLVITGVLRDGTAQDFAADAVVSRVLPHDGRLLIERTDPDVFLVQLGACAADDGPWSLTGTGLAPDLDRRLAELIAQARGWAGRRCCGGTARRRQPRACPHCPGTPSSTVTPGRPSSASTRSPTAGTGSGTSSSRTAPGSGWPGSPRSPAPPTRSPNAGSPCWPRPGTPPTWPGSSPRRSASCTGRPR